MVSFIRDVYRRSGRKIQILKNRLNRPLTLAEKILFGHLARPETQELVRGESYLKLRPDRVAMQDATAQMALLQFMLSGREQSAVPSSIHCDHLILAHKGVSPDLEKAFEINKEVYDFLSSGSGRYGLDFWKPGAGIIHQTVLENYAFPGGLMIGTDSHTPNAGGLGMLASGVGGADAADVMAGLVWEVKNPKLIGVKLTGSLHPWVSAKDIIIRLCGLLTVKGGTNKIIEYFGPGCASLSCTGKGTITNMGAELGATTSLFSFDASMERYLEVTGRKEWAEEARKEAAELLRADPEVEERPEDFFDELIEIDLSALEPHIAGPHSPDRVRPLSEFRREIRENRWPEKLSAALIGSCTNSSFEDIGRAASLVRQTIRKKIPVETPFYISPGSLKVKKTVEEAGFLKTLEEGTGLILANACGPCIGQWQRDDTRKGEVNVIINSFNRNFRGRNDANKETLSFIASPEIVTALAIAGRIDFNPISDPLKDRDGKEFFLEPPSGDSLPGSFSETRDGMAPPEGRSRTVIIRDDSDRIQRLEPFKPWKAGDFRRMPLLAKVKGKCTTDHISPAGPWLRYRGHLDHISDNFLSGAVNAFDETLTGRRKSAEGVESYAAAARAHKKENRVWVVVGDENYGEGSSREHAAMTPRFLGAGLVLARSFARIHETNLKKQGVLALTFADKTDYDRIEEEDFFSLPEALELKPGQPLTLKLFKSAPDGGPASETEIKALHSYNEEQIAWFLAGSALNVLRGQS